MSTNDRWWRTVLGEYPTGVSLVTTVTEGVDRGMIVGTFSAVSQDPPIIAVMPGKSSRTLEHLRASGRFMVSVLGAQHLHVSNAFAKKEADPFASDAFVRSADGLPRLKNPIAWFECRIRSETEMGDHSVLFGDVVDFGVGETGAGFPLIYLKGGFGTFALSGATEVPENLGQRIREVGRTRDILTSFSREHGVACLLGTQLDSEVVVLGAVSAEGEWMQSAELGMSFPFAAPMAASLAAWGGASAERLWIEGMRHLVGYVDRELIARLLEHVRLRGYSTSSGPSVIGKRFDEFFMRGRGKPSELTELWSELIRDVSDQLEDAHGPHNVHSLQFPVILQGGTTTLELVVTGFHPLEDENALEQLIAEGKAAATRIAHAIEES